MALDYRMVGVRFHDVDVSRAMLLDYGLRSLWSGSGGRLRARRRLRRGRG
jgi:hypothetical protein